MGMKWTKEQEQVITLRERNILVSAAAGSGKTAVLVQRILEKVMDERHPIDIDRLLIMTFTRAAAGEMKERISKALEEELYKNPDNEHLQKQQSLIHTAQITTIDGFCAYVIRNYFHLIGLDPGYRTGDEGEMKLLKEDVIKELLEDHYSRKDPQFEHFVECYASGKTDDGIRDLILRLYDAAMSNPHPQEWLEECLENYRDQNVETIRNSAWMSRLWDSISEELSEAKRLVKEALAVCTGLEGPYLYEEALQSDRIFLEEIECRVKERDYNGTSALLSKPVFARLSSKKAKEAVDEKKKDQVKTLREDEKTILKEMSARYFGHTEEELLEMIQCCRAPMEMLVQLTLDFIERFGEKKRERNLLDFTDMEHFALQILMTKEGDSIHMSQAARELSEKYDEVLVDEYQDSNLVQELITTCVSGWAQQRKNIFMVGDVKQSIYRFRLARPELFMEKYKSYSLEDGPEQRIDLHKNFRSRSQVLDSVNYLFRQIMGEDLGGIQYDAAAALYPGASFPKGEEEAFLATEVLLIEKDSEELEEEKGVDVKELEALAVAHRIRSIVGKERIADKHTGQYRPVEYGDIVVLLRTASGWSEAFADVFSAQGIPSYTASRTGYFSAPEVVTVLNYLRICDNPLQDIPMAGVLRSPIAGCTSQELAEIRSKFKEGHLYESLCLYADSTGGEEALKEKLKGFLITLKEFREMSAYTPVHQLILWILDKTGYGKYAKALPDGAQRGGNLTMLVERAMDYEKTSYRGLFNFVRYIEHLQKYEVDYGEVNLSGAGEGSVQIMTIHKSKGLEFPVVFVAGMGKQFNFQDLNAKLLIHPELGIGADAILPEKRVIASTLYKQVIRNALLKESLGEELRVLYVALTRAKEKLILTGSIGKIEKQAAVLSRFRGNEEELLPVGTRLKGKNFWNYVLPALARHKCMDELYEEFGLFPEKQGKLYDTEAVFSVKRVTAADLAREEILGQTSAQMKEEVLKNWNPERVYDGELARELKKRFEFFYPYGSLGEIPVKVSVSELKKRTFHDEEEVETAVFFDPEEDAVIPRFVQEKEEAPVGAARGTAYHRVMECLDYEHTDSDEELRQQIHRLLEQKKLSEKEAEVIRIRDVRRFLETSLGKRMKEAAKRGGLFREQPFMIARRASEIMEGWPEEEVVLVQGIMDAYFLEGDEIVLVDYKTDRVSGDGQELVNRYRGQIEEYAKALGSLLGKPVKERWIYLFGGGMGILV